MARRLSRPALEAILRSIGGIELAIGSKSLAQYQSDWVTKHAVERGIEIISEASRRLPAELRAQRPEIPWKDVIGIGNILRHDYDAIKDRVIYDAATKRLPALKTAIAAIDEDLDEPR